MIEQLTVVGFGLLGGSVAKAARARGLVRSVVAVGRSAARLEPALRDGTADRVTTDLAEGVREANLIVLATPVATLENSLATVWRHAPQAATITDVGSTKAAIVNAAERLERERPLAFVGSHPMAGSEQSGYGVARADLFHGATVVVTPTELSEADAVKRVSDFWQALGARVVILDPEVHDRVAAAISHLPHLVAYALVDAVMRTDAGALEFAARGFRDTTRIAASDPRVWREIFTINAEPLHALTAAFRVALDELERLIGAGAGDALEARLAQIRGAREGLK